MRLFGREINFSRSVGTNNVYYDEHFGPDRSLVNKIAATFGGRLPRKALITPQKAKQAPIVNSALVTIVNTLSQQPLEAFETTVRRERQETCKLFDRRTARMLKLLNCQPSPYWSYYDLLFSIVSDLYLHGNAYLVVQRRNNELLSLTPFCPTTITPQIRPDGRRNERVYIYTPRLQGPPNSPTTPQTGEPQVLRERDVIHIPHLYYDGLQGVSSLRAGLSNSLRSYLYVKQYHDTFFERGNISDLFIKLDSRKTTKQLREFARHWMHANNNGVEGAQVPTITPQGVDVQKMDTNLRNKLLVDLMDHAAREVLDHFKIHPIAANITSTGQYGSGLLEFQSGMLRLSINPMAAKIAKAFSRGLFPEDYLPNANRTRFLKFDSSGVTRALPHEGVADDVAALGNPGSPGFMSINEVRQLRGLPKLDGADYDRVHTGSPSTQNSQDSQESINTDETNNDGDIDNEQTE